MLEIISFALLIGLTHALEADHLATLSNLSLREKNNINALRHGISWSVGHAITLLIVLIPLFMFGGGLSEEFLFCFEILACCILIYLGCKTILDISSNFRQNAWLKLTVLLNSIKSSKSFVRKHRRAIFQLGSWPLNHVSYQALIIGFIHGFAGASVIAVKLQNLVFDVGNLIFVACIFCFGITIAMVVFLKLFLIPIMFKVKSKPKILVSLHICLGVASIGAGLVLVLF